MARTDLTGDAVQKLVDKEMEADKALYAKLGMLKKKEPPSFQPPALIRRRG